MSEQSNKPKFDDSSWLEAPSEPVLEPIVEEAPQPKKKQKKLTKGGVFFFRFLLLVCIGVACFSGYHLFTGIYEYRKGSQAYQELYYSQAGDTSGAGVEDNRVNFESLARINPDIVGWLYLPDSSINYPIVQGRDNEYYLEHLFNGTTNHMGCIFVDYRNTPKFVDKNTAMYAHHMRNGSMFADLEKYKNPSYYGTHKTFWMQTPDGDYIIEPFAGVLLSGGDAFMQLMFNSDEDFIEYVWMFLERSTFQSDIEIQPTDQIITMVTCSYDFENGRYALLGKLTKMD